MLLSNFFCSQARLDSSLDRLTAAHTPFELTCSLHNPLTHLILPQNALTSGFVYSIRPPLSPPPLGKTVKTAASSTNLFALPRRFGLSHMRLVLFLLLILLRVISRSTAPHFGSRACLDPLRDAQQRPVRLRRVSEPAHVCIEGLVFFGGGDGEWPHEYFCNDFGLA